MIDTHVTWTKLSGKPDASMYETKGFGFLSLLEVGRSMFISGDYGVTTSKVKEIEWEGLNVAFVTANSSVYLVETRT